jgi:hypothetical protein
MSYCSQEKQRISSNVISTSLLFVLAFMTVSFSGCAEGVFWKAGKYSPWAQQQWADEEKIANTLFTRKKLMADAVDAAINSPVEERQRVAGQLSEVLYRDKVLLLRLHAIKLLGKLDCPASLEALTDAARDHNSDIRVAAVKAWQSMPQDRAIPQLQEMIGSDSNVDVRLAATRALGSFSSQKAVSALAMALEDDNPALQLRAAESLQAVTGESFGRDIVAWQQYVQGRLPQIGIQDMPADGPGLSPGPGTGFGATQVAEEGSSPFFR